MSRSHTQTCPIAGALNIIGDHWTLLIVREAFYGATRFGEFRKNTGIAKNLLASRLNTLVSEGVFKRTIFADRGTTHAYALTDKGRALQTVMIAIAQWGNTHVYGKGTEPILLIDRTTGEPLNELQIHDVKGDPIDEKNIAFAPGPGASNAVHIRLAEAAAHLAETNRKTKPADMYRK
ncbi:winged helix-turn-helix transcriptional regulator [Kordiimonas aquimaris]|uniref:winged helix-turn-helix transcriptional regulator n=1 Tax=Kordiimonas aquimaris TaxID=707591 RepID=UPI0021D13230|nr:helix-turn-helix domain-containing protein [Kordiimonas aquimaris]